ncbi:MAG: c-type cytochrome biogenesis protein CcmI [Betaproteobacteria bacterium]
MTPLTGFILAALALTVIVLAIVLPPLLRSPRVSTALARREANLDILRDHLTELEHERAEGSLAEADFIQAKQELQRRLLEEVTEETTLPAAPRGRKTALILFVLIPLAASAGYVLLGSPQALDPVHTRTQMNTQQIDILLDKLVARLKANPEDTKGWVMLARSYKSLGRFEASAEAYSHGGAMVDENPTLLADYAEVLLQISDGNFAGKPSRLIAQALKIDPNEPQALFLAGAEAIERKNFLAAIKYWRALLQQLDPESEDAKSLGTAIEKAQEMVAKSGGKPVSKPSFPAETISGTVSLSGKLAAQAQPNDLLFIFARTEEGSRMPLAVKRGRVADLPLSFQLDDSMALPGGQKISSQKLLTIEARVAKSGMAKSSTGDLYGVARKVKPGSKNLLLSIDQVQP